ncbi:hypothetical protein B0I27_106177 [Arcticibacter pallidicorallinus]|uniref:Histidine kinase-like protein n=1 Tax=Arcticibacter pallidicorallinus TaxID=1259464 RepID=A0A2T0U3C7_9SPHI|nr:hypothetical protein B0I27_106177 [Arcticibacter pallidicorallinus]
MFLNKQFIFDNKVQSIQPLMHEVLNFIRENVSPDRYAVKVNNCRHVLVELLTNAVKHSGVENSILSIDIGDKVINIRKTDNGRPFYLKEYGNFPLHASFVGEQIEIHKDELYCIYAIVESTNSLSFEVVEYPIHSLDQIMDMEEHYGLLILLKSSDSVRYLFKEVDGSNHFDISVSLA